MNSQNKLILALDVDTASEARDLVAKLSDVVGAFKIGSQLFTSAGPDFVRELVGTGARVFLDLKFHDIPNTVAAAGVEAARLGVWMFNVHASGGSEMMKRTATSVAEAAVMEGIIAPKIIAVTVLTSSDADTLFEIGVDAQPETQVTRLAQLTKEAGLDGVVASPREIAALRSSIGSKDFLIVTPGVRPAGTSLDDQRRVMTPEAAIRAGANYIVVGRAVLNAEDPVSATLSILDEIKNVK